MARRTSASALPRLLTLVSIVVVVVALSLAREVLIPLALATLITFLLAPLVTRLERWGVKRVLAVLLVSGLCFLVLGGITFLITGQMIDLAKSLPQYRENIHQKIVSLRSSGGDLAEAAEAVNEITDEFSKPATQSATQPTDIATAPEATAEIAQEAEPETPVPTLPDPLNVRVVEPDAAPLQYLAQSVGPWMAPLTTAGIVIVFVLFMLLQREDLRDRLIRLAMQGGSVYVTTQALDDAAHRVGRYLLMNLIVNVTYGVPIGVGLWLIGVPNALLWGLLAIVLRFIPYIGPWMAASMPIALSLAFFPGWTRPLLVIGWFVIVELISNNVIEPWLYGTRTGVSPIAVIFSAVFWTWLWGTPGLLLATPLTVCLVVMGKYIPHLSFLAILMGDEEVLPPHVRFYQRLLAEDVEEACDVAEEHLAEHSLAETYDKVVMPALHLAELDRHAGRVDRGRQQFLRRSIRELVVELAETHRQAELKKAEAEAKAAPGRSGEATEPAVRPAVLEARPAGDEPRPHVLCLPARDEADEIVGAMLVEVFALQGIPAGVVSVQKLASEMVDLVAQSGAKVVCVSALPPSAVTHARYLCKRLRARFPDLTIAAGLWNSKVSAKRASERLSAAGASRVVTSLAEIVAQVCPMVRSLESCAPEVEEAPEAPLASSKRTPTWSPKADAHGSGRK